MPLYVIRCGWPEFVHVCGEMWLVASVLPPVFIVSIVAL